MEASGKDPGPVGPKKGQFSRKVMGGVVSYIGSREPNQCGSLATFFLLFQIFDIYFI
jgi:hypothetical protein